MESRCASIFLNGTVALLCEAQGGSAPVPHVDLRDMLGSNPNDPQIQDRHDSGTMMQAIRSQLDFATTSVTDTDTTRTSYGIANALNPNWADRIGREQRWCGYTTLTWFAIASSDSVFLSLQGCPWSRHLLEQHQERLGRDLTYSPPLVLLQAALPRERPSNTHGTPMPATKGLHAF